MDVHWEKQISHALGTMSLHWGNRLVMDVHWDRLVMDVHWGNRLVMDVHWEKQISHGRALGETD